MRYLALSLTVVAFLTVTACSGKSSSNSSDQSTSSDQTNASAQATAEASAAATDAATSAAAGDIPGYPGAVTEASGSGSSMGGESGSGTVMSTDDSFDKVYAWYQQHLPAGAEKTHTDQPPTAVFTTGDSTSGLKSVTITAADGRTRITIGTVKTQ
ncbi:MAG: hypothetical protein WB609_01310 [Candidatus Cybelea sp.]